MRDRAVYKYVAAFCSFRPISVHSERSRQGILGLGNLDGQLCCWSHQWLAWRLILFEASSCETSEWLLSLSASNRWFFLRFLCHTLLLWVAYISSLTLTCLCLTCLCLTWSLSIQGNSQNGQNRPKSGKTQNYNQKLARSRLHSKKILNFRIKTYFFNRKKGLSFEVNLGSEDRIFGWLAWATKGALRADILFNAFSSCGGGS